MEKVILIIIATINPSETESLNYYMAEMNQLYSEVGAIPIDKYKVSETLIGEDQPNILAIIEFPNQEAIDKVFKSSKYKSLIPYRDKAFLKVEAHLSKP